jgi:hypothetical protein
MSTSPSCLALLLLTGAKVPFRFTVFCLLLLFVLIGASETTRAQSFSNPTSNVVGSNPNAAVAGDFNGDGKPDLAVANFQNDNVSVLINNGSGAFAAAVNYSTDLHPQTIAAGDFNGDSKLDLAVGNFHGGTGTGNISILLGNGNGTFQAAVNYAALNPDSLNAVDLNGDGKLDLVEANWTNGAVVLLGNGNGTFGAATTYPAGSQPIKLTVADFNNDGKSDLAAANQGQDKINILLGNGNGTFQAPSPFTSAGEHGVAAADLNNDGKQDLMAVGNGLTVYLGNGNGTFQAGVIYVGGDSIPAFGDFNGDGKLDIATGDYFGGTVVVNRGNGDGTFQAPLTFPAKPNPTSLVVADLDVDGKPDLAIASNGTGRENVLLNSPSVNALAATGFVAGAPLTNVLVGSFFDYDTTKTASSFTATIDWGDPTPSTSGTVSANGSGGFNVNGSHTYAKEGAYLLTIHIADTSGNFASDTSTLVVADAPLTATGKTFTAVQGVAYVSTVANFTDADPGGTVADFSATVNYGDGVTLPAMILTDGHGGFDVFGNHAYSNTGTFSVVVTINDVGGSTATANSTANVTGPTLQFELTDYFVTESGGSAQIRVVRMGDATGTASVNYATSDTGSPSTCSATNGKASSRCDFTTAVGTLNFATGETQKTFSVLISQDSFVEGSETVVLTLSNATGAAVLGSPSTATLTINDDATEPSTNPIDVSSNFVRQHYLDFLNREPDTAGLNFWIGEIENCTPKPQCTEIKRINVSAAFFLSIEFQETGYLVERLHKVAYGSANGTSSLGGAHSIAVPFVRLKEFLSDTQAIGQGVVVGQPGWEQALENNKVAFTAQFVQRGQFLTSMSPPAFVDRLFLNAGVTPTTAERNAAIADFGSANDVTDVPARARAVRRVAENPTLTQQEKNSAFVLMQYLGYLRRNPNDVPDSDYTGYDFWLGKLNEFNGNFVNAEMVKAFLVSGEYRQRFGP